MNDRDAVSAAAIAWEGPLFATQSLALVNRELCLRLLSRGLEVGLQPFEAVPPDLPEALAPLVACSARALSRAPDITVRHQWPPDFSPVRSGRLVVMQPWEFGSLPRAWIDPINECVDEVWANTPYVRDCYLRSGVDPARVFVVPLGADPAHFRPGVAPLALPTERGFRFLFVGGTIFRKGIDILLRAYEQAFSQQDDVCLVVKAMGADTSYRDQHQRDSIEALRARPGAPELLYLEDELDAADMPGLYAAADCLVHPYRGEGFGLPIVEAMSCALPVVVTDRGAARAFCEESWSYLIPSTELRLRDRFVGDFETVDHPSLAEPDADALASILREIHERPDAARRRGIAAREQIRTRFSWEHAVDAQLERIAALLERPPLRDPGRGRRQSAPERATPVIWSAAPFNYSGYAKISRSLLPALERAGLPVRLKAFGTDPGFAEAFDRELQAAPAEGLLWNRLLNRQLAGGVGVCLHPPVSWDGHRFFRGFRRENPRLDAYVGFTMFETDRLPPRWASECNEMDEVWVPSDFNRGVFAESGVDLEKIRVFHPGLDTDRFQKLDAPFEIPGRRGFVFLSVFQWSLRKGWDVLLDAWARAFTADDDVCLAVRAYPAQQKEPPIRVRIDRHLRSQGHSRERCAPIVVLEDFIPDGEMPRLYAAADAFVLPSRGEAWGLPYLEAMACGLPTLAPDWGGQLQFMHEHNAYLIEVEGLEPVAEEQSRENPYYTRELRWAMPSATHTAELMREVFDDPESARERGRVARAEVFARWSLPAAIEAFEGLAADLSRRGPARGAPPDRFAIPGQVLWNSPLYDSSGYADEARQFVCGLDGLGVPVTCLPVTWSDRDAELEDAERNLFVELEARPLGDGGALVHVQHAFAEHFRPSPKLRASVGRTMFETDSIPQSWVEPCNAMDEIWVPSEWNRETFARAGVCEDKLQVIPSPLDRARFEGEIQPLPVSGRRGFAFLSLFDWSRRKGWDVLLRAFAEEFGAGEDVCLILKAGSSAGLRTAQLEKKVRRYKRKQLARGRTETAPILWIESHHAAREMPRVYRAADAYVMPSRGEGWGRPYMEAMACGLPVIGTGWGGNTAYMNERNSYLLEFDLVPVAGEALREAPQFQGHRWAEPRLASLRACMREVFEHRGRARARGARAREEVLARFDRSVVAQQVRSRLECLGIDVGVGRAATGGGPCPAR